MRRYVLNAASKRRWFTGTESLVFLALFTVLVTGIPLHGFAAQEQGSVQMLLQGYGSVKGQLLNATLQPNGSISMVMTVNDKMQTSYGSFPVSASGVWDGVASGSTVSGLIQSVTGQVQICVLSCGYADFAGNGHWNGSIMNMVANGTFYGTIIFTSSAYPQQLPVGQSIPVSGTWNAKLLQESAVPEFNSELIALTGAAMITLIVGAVHRQSHRRTASVDHIPTPSLLRKYRGLEYSWVSISCQTTL